MATPSRVHQGVHAALDALFVGMVETGAHEGQAVVRRPDGQGGSLQLTLRLLGPDDPPCDYDPEAVQESYSGVWDPATRTFHRNPPPET